MGKGGGCVPSKKRHPAVKADQPPTASVDRDDTATDSAPDPATAPASAPAPASVGTLAPTSSSASIKIFIVFYSMYGHVEGLAQRMKKGVDGIEGAEGVLYRVPETLSQDVLDQMKAPEKDASVPVITAEELVEADGVLFGFPTRYGSMAAQMKAFWDSTSLAADFNFRKYFEGFTPSSPPTMDCPLPLPTLNLANLEALSVLGRGAKGVVFLVRTGGPNGPIHALKTIYRSSISKPESSPRRIWSERDVLLSLRHPLLPSLHGVLETDRIVAFAIDRCPGGDLNALRRRQTEQMFSDDIIRFYAAELVLALDHLHSLGIVYRDLKPENVLIQETGHLMLVDFDLSIRLPPPDPGATDSHVFTSPEPAPTPPRRRRLLSCFSRDVGVSPEIPSESGSSSCSGSGSVVSQVKSNSFVGTEEYVAPEVIKGDGHDFSVDWWGLGVVLYEMLYGRTPFRGQNRKETFYRILSKEPELVGEQTPLRDLIGRLLEKVPEQRISGEDIKKHEFFRGVDWESVTEVGRPPFIPVEAELEEGEEGREMIDVEKFVEDVFGNAELSKEGKIKEGNWQVTECRYPFC